MWVNFVLDDCWLDLCVFKDITDLAGCNIADTDVANEALAHELLHGLPSLLVGHAVINHNLGNESLFVIEPAAANDWRCTVFLSDRVMDQIQVQVIDFKVS